MMQFYSLPVDAPLRITSKFGPRDTGIQGASTYHKGVDLGRDKSKSSTNILSVAPGTIAANYWNKYRGWVVVVQHNGYRTLYQHLKEQCKLPVGTIVKSGTILGVMGNSSDRSVLKVSEHLHFELIVDSKNIDPEPYLESISEVKTMLERITKAVPITDTTSLEKQLTEQKNTSMWWVIDKLLKKLGL